MRTSSPQLGVTSSRGKQEAQILQTTFRRWKTSLAYSKRNLSLVWPKFTIALNKHEWVIYPSFGVLLVIFFLLLPRGCRYR